MSTISAYRSQKGSLRVQDLGVLGFRGSDRVSNFFVLRICTLVGVEGWLKDSSRVRCSGLRMRN